MAVRARRPRSGDGVNGRVLDPGVRGARPGGFGGASGESKAPRAFSARARVMSVSMKLGATALTVMPLAPTLPVRGRA